MPNGTHGRAVPRLALAVAEYRQRFGMWPTYAAGAGVMSIVEPPGTNSDPDDHHEFSPVRAKAVLSRLACSRAGGWIELSGPEGRCGYGLVHRDHPLVLESYRWLYGEDPWWANGHANFKAIHLIYKGKPGLPAIDPMLPRSGLAPTGEETRFFCSGNWKLAVRTAIALLGARIYFHEKKVEPSSRGGSIINFDLVREGLHAGRIIFAFDEDSSGKGVSTSNHGWNNFCKIVRT
jgi:hypothetical protein